MSTNNQSLRNPALVGGGRAGIYGSILGVRHSATKSNGFRDSGQEFAPGVNRQTAFGNMSKRDRNIKRTRGIFRTNIWACFRTANTPAGSGQKVEYCYADPSVQAYLHLADKDELKNTKGQRVTWAQTADQIVQAHRVNANRMHSAHIRPAAPAQVSWKTSYIVGQRNIQPIGPYQSMQQRSILQRLAASASKAGKGTG